MGHLVGPLSQRLRLVRSVLVRSVTVWLACCGAVCCTGACGEGRLARRLIQQGRFELVLQKLRPVGAEALAARAKALRRLGRLKQARTEALLAIAIDPQLPEALAELGLTEAALGNRGAAVDALKLAVQLRPSQACWRSELARLLVWRAWYRIHPGSGLNQTADAKRELEQVEQLDPCLHAEMMPRFAWLERQAFGGKLAQCPGPAAVMVNRLPQQRHCSQRNPKQQVRRFLRRELLLGCRGVQLAVQLQQRGCLAAAQSIWQAMVDESPGDPRWLLYLAQVLMLRHQVARAEVVLTTLIYQAKEPAETLLLVASMLERVGKRRRAAARSVEMLPYAVRLEQQLRALRILQRNGTSHQLELALQYVAESGSATTITELRRLLKADVNEAR